MTVDYRLYYTILSSSNEKVEKNWLFKIIILYSVLYYAINL